jgi:hypothetical protein
LVTFSAMLESVARWALRPSSGRGSAASSEWLGGVVGVATPGVILVAVAVGLLIRDTWRHRGVSVLRRRALRRKGMRVPATVIDVNYETPIMGSNNMILEICPPDRPPYRLEVAEDLEVEWTEFVMRGHSLFVFVDPANPKAVAVDKADLERKGRDKARAKAEEHARMLRGS